MSFGISYFGVDPQGRVVELHTERMGDDPTPVEAYSLDEDELYGDLPFDRARCRRFERILVAHPYEETTTGAADPLRLQDLPEPLREPIGQLKVTPDDSGTVAQHDVVWTGPVAPPQAAPTADEIGQQLAIWMITQFTLLPLLTGREDEVRDSLDGLSISERCDRWMASTEEVDPMVAMLGHVGAASFCVMHPKEGAELIREWQALRAALAERLGGPNELVDAVLATLAEA